MFSYSFFSFNIAIYTIFAGVNGAGKISIYRSIQYNFYALARLKVIYCLKYYFSNI